MSGEPSSNPDEITAPARRRKRKWSELSRGTRVGIVVAGAAELIMTTLALRDLSRRPAERVRGPKWLWVPMCFVQPVGSPLYFLVGRRAEP